MEMSERTQSEKNIIPKSDGMQEIVGEAHPDGAHQALDRISQFLHFLDSDKRLVENETEAVKQYRSKLLALVNRCSSEGGVSADTVERLKYVVIAFLDLTRIDRMQKSPMVEDAFQQRYGREDEDERVRAEDAKAAVSQKAVVAQDDLYEWFTSGNKKGSLPVVPVDATPFDTVLDSLPNQDSLVYIDEAIDELVDELDEFVDSKSDRYYVRKTKTLVASEDLDAQRYYERHEAHYKHFFAYKGVEPSDVILTNSGSRSNEAVIKVLAGLSGKANAYVQPGWYYENVESITKNFNETSIDRARVFFLNANSSAPYDSDDFFKELEKNISKVFEFAQMYPDEKFTLVVDVSTDLLFSQFPEDVIPSNLILIKTFSGTKHQRGGKNYFFGGISIWNASEDLVEGVKQGVRDEGAELGKLSILHYPRLRQSEVEETTERLRTLHKMFAAELSLQQTKVPDGLKLEVCPYNYYVYCAIPSLFFFKKNGEALKKLINSDEFMERNGIVSGDSFGLEESRMCTINGYTEEDIMRFSFGLDSTQEQVLGTAREIGSAWNELIYEGEITSADDTVNYFRSNKITVKENLDKMREEVNERCEELRRLSISGDEKTFQDAFSKIRSLRWMFNLRNYFFDNLSPNELSQIKPDPSNELGKLFNRIILSRSTEETIKKLPDGFEKFYNHIMSVIDYREPELVPGESKPQT